MDRLCTAQVGGASALASPCVGRARLPTHRARATLYEMARKLPPPHEQTPTTATTATQNDVPAAILACIRGRIGASASLDKCAVTLAAAAGISTQVARKLLSGRAIRRDVAVLAAYTLADWGCDVGAAALVMGSAIATPAVAT